MDNALSQAPRYKHRKLFKYSQHELDNLFETLSPINFSELDGVYQGRLFAIIGLGFLPRFLRTAFYSLLQTIINPWKGKSFKNNQGANVWLTHSGQYRFAAYKVANNEDGSEAYLNYDLDENWKILRPIRGEARQLNNNTVLARMNYTSKTKTHRVLYFTLQSHNTH